jgi:hypothetical protein
LLQHQDRALLPQSPHQCSHPNKSIGETVIHKLSESGAKQKAHLESSSQLPESTPLRMAADTSKRYGNVLVSFLVNYYCDPMSPDGPYNTALSLCIFYESFLKTVWSSRWPASSYRIPTPCYLRPQFRVFSYIALLKFQLKYSTAPLRRNPQPTPVASPPSPS